MKKLLIKTIVFIALFIVADYGIGLLFNTLQKRVSDYPIGNANAYLKAVNTIDEDIVIIGESRASCHFIPSVLEDSLKMTAINAATHGSSMTQQAAVIRMMLNRHVPILLLWEVNPMGLMDTWLDEELDGMMDLAPFYGVDSLSRSLICQRGEFEYIKMLSQSYRNNNKLTDYLLILLKGKYNDLLKGYTRFPATGKHPSKKIVTYEEDLSQDKLNLLEETLKYIQKKECKVVLVSSPQWGVSNLNETTQAKAFETLVDSLGIPYLNHRYDERFKCDSTYYKDVYHLNEKGATAYMHFFIPELKQCLKGTE